MRTDGEAFGTKERDEGKPAAQNAPRQMSGSPFKMWSLDADDKEPRPILQLCDWPAAEVMRPTVGMLVVLSKPSKKKLNVTHCLPMCQFW